MPCHPHWGPHVQTGQQALMKSASLPCQAHGANSCQVGIYEMRLEVVGSSVIPPNSPLHLLSTLWSKKLTAAPVPTSMAEEGASNCTSLDQVLTHWP